MEILGFYEAIHDGARKELKNFNFSMIATVSSIDNLSDGFIDVEPVCNYLDYSMTESEVPTIYDVPVLYPNTTTSSITVPIQQGDGVLLVFTQHRNDDYLEGVEGKHLPLSQSWLALHNAVAFVGFQNINKSGYNPNNYKNKLDMNDLNIVHNKNTENEVVISFNSNGDLTINAGEKTINTVSKEINAKCETINANSALIKTENDIQIKGHSVYNFMTTHDHNYTDDGSPMITAIPNLKD